MRRDLIKLIVDVGVFTAIVLALALLCTGCGKYGPTKEEWDADRKECFNNGGVEYQGGISAGHTHAICIYKKSLSCELPR